MGGCLDKDVQRIGTEVFGGVSGRVSCGVAVDRESNMTVIYKCCMCNGRFGIEHAIKWLEVHCRLCSRPGNYAYPDAPEGCLMIWDEELRQ